jgi:hypothetical protein
VTTWKFVALVWLTSRALFLATGFVGARYVVQAHPAGFPLDPGGLLSYWANWDGAWFAAIATDGYLGTIWPSSASFYPIFPALVHAGVVIGLGPAFAGVAVSLAASLFALYFLHELTRERFGVDAARAATMSIAFFPTTFFLNAVYSESVFLATAIGAIWAARLRSNFGVASVLGCVATGTRNIGILLVIPLVHEWYRQRETSTKRDLASIALVPSSLIAFMAWIWHWGEQPFAFATAQAGWGRRLTNPISTLDRAWHVAVDGWEWAVHPGRVLATSSGNPAFGAMDTFNFAFLVLFVALLAGVVYWVRGGLAVYAVLAGLLPILNPAGFAPLASLPRYVLGAFPMFMVLGCVLARSRIALVLWLAASGALGVLFTVYFTSWRWVA